MSRSYSNFLLFEDVLDAISPSDSVIMAQAVQTLLNPTVQIVEEDCNTLLGEITETSVELQGRIEAATKAALTNTRITALLAAGQYKTGLRTLPTCQSHVSGGVCRICYSGSLLGSVAPAVGSTVNIPALQIYQSDTLGGNGFTTTFNLSQTSDDWYDVKVVKNGVVQTSGYTLGYNTITISPAIGVNEIVIVHFMKQNTDPLQGYIAKTYSGALLGMQPLPTIKPLLRESLYEPLFSDSFIGLMMEELKPLKAIPSTYIDYLQRVHSKFEKILLALYLFALYSNVEV